MNQGERLKKIFSYYGKSITEYADHIGKHKSNVSKKIKQGDFDETQIESFAIFLGISTEELQEQLSYDPGQSDYVKKLESDVEHLREIRDGLKRENEKNEKLLEMQEREINVLREELSRYGKS